MSARVPLRRLSVIVPAANEAESIADALEPLQALRERGHEVIVVDGESEDGTAAVAAAFADRVLEAPRGRARQMNAGAAAAAGEVLVFVHADTLLPQLADLGIVLEMARLGRHWGRFDVRLSGVHPLLRVIERTMSLRSRLTGIATGDQAIFVERALFEAVGGYPDIPLMEDVALSRTLKRTGRPLCLWRRVVTSSRRWETRGIVRTVLLMWWLRAAFALGADPARLAAAYERR